MNEKLKHKLPAPIPIDIIVLVATTASSYFWNWEGNYKIAIIGFIPSGTPTPTFPLGSDWTKFLKPGIVFGLISYFGTPVMYRHFSEKHGYHINLKQELCALAVCFISGSCLSSVGLNISAARIFMMETSGGRTQISYVFAALTSLAVIMLLADYGHFLPKCIVAVILVVAFSRASANFKRIYKYWRSDKFLFLIWVFTFTIAMLFTVSDGVLYGIGFSVLLTAIKTVLPRVKEVQECSFHEENYLVEAQLYDSAIPIKTSKIVSIKGPVFFANLEKVRENITKLIESCLVDKPLSSTSLSNDSVQHCHSNSDIGQGRANEGVQFDKNHLYVNKMENNSDMSIPVQHITYTDYTHISNIVLDFSGVYFVDTTALKMLVDLKKKLATHNKTLCLASCNEPVRNSFLRAPNVVAELEDQIYATVYDAVKAKHPIDHHDVTEDDDSVSDDSDKVTYL